MLHKNIFRLFFIISLFIGLHQTIICMDLPKPTIDYNNRNQNLDNLEQNANIDLLLNKNKVEEQKLKNDDLLHNAKIKTEKQQAAKLKNDDLLHNAKIKTEKQQAAKLKKDISERDPLWVAATAAGQAVKDLTVDVISKNSQYYFKRKIDLWFDGCLTTVELLAELNEREKFLGQEMVNVKTAADSYEKFLTDPTERKEFNAKTKNNLKNIIAELDENARLYNEAVASKRKK